ncbi:MAG: YihY/virulence factor BrkB family protein [Candidatus Dormibacteria bacterium]
MLTAEAAAPVARDWKSNVAVRWVWGYVNGPATHYAPAVAFNAFVALFPFILGLVSLLVLVAPGRRGLIQTEFTIRQAIPVGSAADIGQMLQAINRHAHAVGLLSLAGMAWAGSAMFSCLGGALNAVHGVHGRNVVSQRLMGLRLVGGVIAGIAAVVILDMVARALGPPFTGAPVRLVLAALVLVTLLVAVYRFAPNHAVTIAQALPGALVATVLIELVTWAVRSLSGLIDNASSYGQGIALALAFLTWLYLVAHSILLGATFNEIRVEATRAGGATVGGGGRVGRMP